MKTMLLPMIWLFTGAMMIWKNNDNKKALVWAGVMIGWASWILLDAYMPLFMRQMLWAFHWFNVVGLWGFMLIFGSLTAVIIWVFDRW